MHMKLQVKIILAILWQNSKKNPNSFVTTTVDTLCLHSWLLGSVECAVYRPCLSLEKIHENRREDALLATSNIARLVNK